LQVSRLKLIGFKSFVEPAELRIERGLTGIVGPNGCGKSNLLEAIRWVMGEASPKSLRGGAMDDVIFAGTATRPAREFAEVSLLAEGVEALGGDAEVVRRIDRGAGSGYRINGNDVRAKDVSLLFADAATGAHSPALVSQGRISAIIAARPAERRAMLEEAAGISGLHVRRKDAEQKLRATEANLTRIDELITDMDARMANLRRQARSAERYRTLSHDIRVAEARLIFVRWQTAAVAADAAKADAAKADAEVAAAAEQQRAVAAHQQESAIALAAARRESLVTRDAVVEANHQLAALRAERDGLSRRIKEILAQTERLAADREREGQLGKDAAEALATLGEEVKALDASLARVVDVKPALIAKLAQAEAQVRDREVDLAKAMAEQAREQAETRVAEAAFQVAQKRLDRATQDLDGYRAQLKALGDDIAALAARNEAAAQAKAAQKRSEELRRDIEVAEAERTTAAAERETVEADVGGLAADLAALEGEAVALRKTLDSGAGRNRALDQVSAERGYERALGAALGDDLEAAIGADGRRGWRGAVSKADDPLLPPDSCALIAHVTAPSQLGRRLSQIAVVEKDEGQVLAVGQRLVTREGYMRRWDGLVETEAGAAAADRMIRVNRLMDVQQLILPARDKLSKARATLERLRTQTEQSRQRSESARAELRDIEAKLRTAQRSEDQANATLERVGLRRTELAERISYAQTERQAAEKEHQAAKQKRTEVPDGSATTRLVASLVSAAESARRAVADLRAQIATHEREVDGQRSQLSAAKASMKSWHTRAGDAAKRIEEMTKRARATEAEARLLAGAPAKLDGEIADALAVVEVAMAAAESARAAESAAQTVLEQLDKALAGFNETIAAAREIRAGARAKAENEELRRIEMGRVSGERFECPPPLLPEKLGFDGGTVRDVATESGDLERLSHERERLGPVNLIAEQELAEIDANRATTKTERDELEQAVHRLRGSIGSLNREGRARLMAAFTAVDDHFQRLFARLFNGGAAHLEMIDSDDPLEAGLEIFAQPPGKKLTSLSLLSGGEQALTAVALIFGLFLTNPAPICVLDEVDAPLDDANIERFCDLLDAMTRETATRYLIVTHNAVTMSRMHRLFGVTMVEQGVSRLVSVDLTQAERMVA
jgi:chromosome segregation protein